MAMDYNSSKEDPIGGTNQNSTSESIEVSLRLIDDLKFFMATAPANWQENQIIRRYYLNDQEGFISCVYWKNIYYITGTDIVRGISYKFKHFGREILDQKKFEEGIFSDLRGLKCGTDAVLEGPRSEFLNFLHKNQCLRTQKKQKVFFWFSVPHDKLFSDALERDLKRELEGKQNSTTRACSEPAKSFEYDRTQPLHEQLLTYLESKRQETYLPEAEFVDAEAANIFTAPALVETTANPEKGSSKQDMTGDTDEIYIEHEPTSMVDSPNPITPLFVTAKISTQEVTVPRTRKSLKKSNDSEDSNDQNQQDIPGNDQYQDTQDNNDEDDDDFPLNYFQMADLLTEQQNLLDQSLFLQSAELNYQPLLIEQSEKLLRSASTPSIYHNMPLSAAQRFQSSPLAISHYPHQLQAPQQAQIQAQFDEYVNELRQQQQQQHLQMQHALPQQQHQLADYNIGGYTPHYYPYHSSPQYPPQPPQVFNAAYNPYYYDPAIAYSQQQQAQLRGFPSSQATAPPLSGVPQLGIFTKTPTTAMNPNQSKPSSGKRDHHKQMNPHILNSKIAKVAQNINKKKSFKRLVTGFSDLRTNDTNSSATNIASKKMAALKKHKDHVKQEDHDMNDFFVAEAE